MIKLRKEWQHKSFAESNFDYIKIAVKQLIHFIPEDKTDEEEKLFLALKTIDEYINNHYER